jgi:N-acetyl-gamma-glutamylphosphate reductase
MAKTRRKKAATIDVNKVEIMAPVKSYQLDSYRRRECKVVDLSAGKDLEDMKLYWIYYEGNQKYILNLTLDFAETVKKIAPRKVFTD